MAINVKKRGMALLEVLVAMLVVGVAILPLVMLQVKSNRAITEALNETANQATALSIMSLIEADANKQGWNNLKVVSGECSGSGCTDWRRDSINKLLIQSLPVSGDSLACVKSYQNHTSASLDTSFTVEVVTMWYTAGRNEFPVGDNKTGAFVQDDCDRSAYKSQLNVGHASVSRVFR